MLTAGASFAAAPVEPDYTTITEQAAQTREQRIAWWREARFGMFIHFGLYSIAADDWPGVPHGRYSEWLMSRGVPHEDYRRVLTPKFQPRAYDPAAWAALAKEAGMEYVILTTKHHDGFSLWDTAASDYNVVDNTPYGSDMIGPFADAVRAAGLHVGFYYAILDWYHPDYVPRRKDNDSRPPAGPEVFGRYLDFMEQQIRELLTNFGRVDVLWWDGGWEHNAEEQRATRLNGIAYSLQPNILLGDRNGLPGDFATTEQKLMDPLPDRDWETCLTINGSWGFHRLDTNWKTTADILKFFSKVATGGGNFLLNVGPDADGRIPEPEVQRIREIGQWMKVHANAIRGTSRWPLPCPTPWGGGTVRLKADGSGTLYLHVHEPAAEGVADLKGLKAAPQRIYWLDEKDTKDGAITYTAPTLHWAARINAPAVSVIVLEFDRPFMEGKARP